MLSTMLYMSVFGFTPSSQFRLGHLSSRTSMAHLVRNSLRNPLPYTSPSSDNAVYFLLGYENHIIVFSMFRVRLPPRRASQRSLGLLT